MTGSARRALRTLPSLPATPGEAMADALAAAGIAPGSAALAEALRAGGHPEDAQVAVGVTWDVDVSMPLATELRCTPAGSALVSDPARSAIVRRSLLAWSLSTRPLLAGLAVDSGAADARCPGAPPAGRADPARVKAASSGLAAAVSEELGGSEGVALLVLAEEPAGRPQLRYGPAAVALRDVAGPGWPPFAALLEALRPWTDSCTFLAVRATLAPLSAHERLALRRDAEAAGGPRSGGQGKGGHGRGGRPRGGA